MPISIDELLKAAVPLHQRILDFLRENPKQAFSILELISAIEEIPASDVPALVLAQRKAAGESQLLTAYERALHDLENDVMSGRLVMSAEHGGTWYFGIKPGGKT